MVFGTFCKCNLEFEISKTICYNRLRSRVPQNLKMTILKGPTSFEASLDSFPESYFSKFENNMVQLRNLRD